MVAPRILFALPDVSEPSGGVRHVYRLVEVLVEEGFDAAVWHHEDGFRPGWFDSPAPVVAGAEQELTDDHLVVVPEVLVLDGHDPAPGGRTAILNQNPFYSFDNVAAGPTYPGWSSRPNVWANSPEGTDVLQQVLPHLDVSYLPHWIDTSLHRPRSASMHRRIAFMPRKRRRDATIVTSILRDHLSLDGWEIVAIRGATEGEAAEVLGSSDVFLAFGEQEGFVLPVAEAMASGCYVVGYTGGSGGGLFADQWSTAIADGDLLGFVESTVAVVDRLERGELRDAGAAARDFIGRTYVRSEAAARLVELVEIAAKADAEPSVRAEHPLAFLERCRPPAPTDLTRVVEDLEARIWHLQRIADTVPELRRNHGVALAAEAALRDELTKLRGELSEHTHLQLEALNLAFKLEALEAALAGRNDALARRVEALEDSTSWRVTAPLRRLSGLLGRS